MRYINTETNEIVSHEILLALHPITSFPEGDDFVPPFPFTAILPSDKPSFDKRFQQAVESTPVFQNDEYVQGWEIIEIFSTQEEKDNALAMYLNIEKEIILKNISLKAETLKYDGVLVEGVWIHTDLHSRTKWLAMMNSAIPSIEIATMDDTLIATSPELATLVFQATAQLDVAILNHSKSLAALVEASEAPNSVDIASNWPVTYTTKP